MKTCYNANIKILWWRCADIFCKHTKATTSNLCNAYHPWGVYFVTQSKIIPLQTVKKVSLALSFVIMVIILDKINFVCKGIWNKGWFDNWLGMLFIMKKCQTSTSIYFKILVLFLSKINENFFKKEVKIYRFDSVAES